MKPKELRQKSTQELKKLLEETQIKLGKLKFDSAVQKIKKHTDIPKARKLIARILTILEERGIKK